MNVRKITLIAVIVVVPLVFAWSPSATESFILSAVPDTVGGVGTNTATIYASFRMAPEVSFRVTGPDVWAVSDMTMGEDVTQEDPIVLMNDGAAVIDLAFHLGAEDIITAPDAVPWTSRDNWGGSVTPSEYTLGLILCDPTITTGPDIVEFEVDDILRPGGPVWYSASGQFRPFTSTLVYEHEGSVSLSLFSADGMNTVNSYFRLQLTRSGSLDDYPHAARVVVTCRLSSG